MERALKMEVVAAEVGRGSVGGDFSRGMVVGLLRQTSDVAQ